MGEAQRVCWYLLFFYSTLEVWHAVSYFLAGVAGLGFSRPNSGYILSRMGPTWVAGLFLCSQVKIKSRQLVARKQPTTAPLLTQ